MNNLLHKRNFNNFKNCIISTARTTTVGSRQIPDEAVNTSWIAAFFNKVADAFNGKVKKDENSPYRTVMTDTSFHNEFLKEGISHLKRMLYVDCESKKKKTNQPSSLKSLESTMRGIQLLWRRLKEIGFRHLKTKNLNQDPLENFFSRIRDFGQNNKPTCFQFIGFFKSLIINTFTKSHSEGANCSEDDTNFAHSWENFFNYENVCLHNNSEQRNVILENCRTDPIPEKGSVSTCSAHLLKKLIKTQNSIVTCDECKSSPVYFTNKFNEAHEDLKSIVRRIFSPLYHKSSIKKSIIPLLMNEINFEFVKCTVHKTETVSMFLNIALEQYVQSVTSFINNILNGKIIYEISNKCNINEIVIKACAKRASSLHKKKTFNTLRKM